MLRVIINDLTYHLHQENGDDKPDPSPLPEPEPGTKLVKMTK